MNLARSTYYYSPRGRRCADEGALTARIEAICEEFPRYGYGRVTAQLRHEGWHINRKRVAHHARTRPEREIQAPGGLCQRWRMHRGGIPEPGPLLRSQLSLLK